MTSITRVLGALVACGLLSGCATPVSVGAWQRRVEEYVAKEGNDDPSVLGDVTLADGRPGFGMIGGAAPSGSVDANGLLLGHRNVEGRPTLFYLVGILDNQKVSDLRLAAVSFDPAGKALWRVGERDEKALQAFNDHKLAYWKSRFESGREPPAAYLVFPGPEDQFQLDVQGERASAIHTTSGTRWILALQGR